MYNKIQKLKKIQEHPRGLMVKNLPANVGDTGSIPGLGRFHIAVGN